MCPACIAIAAMVTVGSASAGGLTVTAFKKARSDKTTDDRIQETESKQESREQ